MPILDPINNDGDVGDDADDDTEGDLGGGRP